MNKPIILSLRDVVQALKDRAGNAGSICKLEAYTQAAKLVERLDQEMKANIRAEADRVVEGLPDDRNLEPWKSSFTQRVEQVACRIIPFFRDRTQHSIAVPLNKAVELSGGPWYYISTIVEAYTRLQNGLTESAVKTIQQWLPAQFPADEKVNPEEAMRLLERLHSMRVIPDDLMEWMKDKAWDGMMFCLFFYAALELEEERRKAGGQASTV